MKKMAIAGFTLIALTACSYGGVAVTQDGKAIVARNDGLLFGAMRQVSVCEVSAAGLTSCKSADVP